MRIHTVEIRHVRQFEELTLDLSAPLTVIGGPNGVGKTTLQEAILAAMFARPKAVRDSFVSQFDTAAEPTVSLGLSRGEEQPTVCLTRCLVDDQGEWKEGAKTLKKKKEALEKVQEVVPISADAAALLLWGRQDDMCAVLETFPSDGHSLLTAATVKGCGPDPKQIIKNLDKDSDHARKGERGGQVVGPLIQARKRLQELERERDRATAADSELHTRREQLSRAKSQRDQLKRQFQEIECELKRLSHSEKLLEPALKHMAVCRQMEERQTQWDKHEAEIESARKDVAALKREYEQLRVQYRVARDQELAEKLESLDKQIERVATLEAGCGGLEKELKSKKRPSPAEVKSLQTLQERIRVATGKMEATGVRYELTAEGGPRTVRIAEDGQMEQEIMLAPGEVRRGIVGRVTIAGVGVCFAAAGKEDISGCKNAIRKAEAERAGLFQRHQVDDEATFLRLAAEGESLQQSLEKQRQELKLQLRGATTATLKGELEQLRIARDANNLSAADQENYAGKRLPPPAELDRWSSEKHGEMLKAKATLDGLEAQRPEAAERRLHEANLTVMRGKAREAAAAFSAADELRRNPSKELQEEVRGALERNRQEQSRLNSAFLAAEKLAADLSGQLKQTQPHRPLDAIQSELDDAQAAFHREQTLQEARARLARRIEETSERLAAHVPRELSEKVTRHLARLTGGGGHHVALSGELAVAHVAEQGADQTWQPRQLSCGERQQAALAVKIAVASALAEASGPVFIVLDDSLVNFDPFRRAATEDFLLELAADGGLQIILLTCHTDWAEDFKQRRPDEVSYIDLVQTAHYYRPPPAVAQATKDEIAAGGTPRTSM